MTERSFGRSQEMFDRARGVLAGGVTSGFRAFEKPVPLFFDRAKGSRLWDLDGNEFVDFACGYGPIILGHGDEQVLEAVMRAASAVQQVGGQTELQLELAETLCRHVPGYEMVRFSVSGSEAVHGALRLARAATGRDLIVKFAGQYHGWFDNVLAGTGELPENSEASPALEQWRAVPESAGQSAGALADVVVIDWNDTAQLKSVFDAVGPRIAAVIMEPVACNQGVFYPEPGYLEEVRRLTSDYGSVLIFDEVITGFRFGLGGAQETVGVTPDLTVTAKAMGNGFPISAFGGRRDLMELVGSNAVVHGGTYNGGGLSMAAALATVAQLAADDGRAYDAMSQRGRRLMNGLQAAASSAGVPLQARGPGPVFCIWISAQEVRSYREHLGADGESYARFAEALLRRGVRVMQRGVWFLSAAHTDDDVDIAISAAADAFEQIHTADAQSAAV